MRMKFRSVLILSVLALAATIGCTSRRPPYIPDNPELRRLPVYFYPASSAAPAKAVIFFFGNDVGFWTPHRDLADFLSGQGYSVVGFDMRSFGQSPG